MLPGIESVRYASYNKLSTCLPAAVILCVDSALTVSGAPFIEGNVVAIDHQNDSRGCPIYIHSITYDAAQLTNPDGTLAECDITGVVCRGCLTTYIDYLISTVTPP